MSASGPSGPLVFVFFLGGGGGGGGGGKGQIRQYTRSEIICIRIFTY